MKKLGLCLSAALASLVATTADASVVVTFRPTVNGVQANVFGSLDTSYFTLGSSNVSQPIAAQMRPSTALFIIKSISSDIYQISGSLKRLGGSANIYSGSSAHGMFGLVPQGDGAFDLYLPAGYVSGSEIAASTRFLKSTISSLGISSDVEDVLPGNQTITFKVLTAVPEPASWALMLGGFGMIGAALRRRTARIAFAR